MNEGNLRPFARACAPPSASDLYFPTRKASRWGRRRQEPAGRYIERQYLYVSASKASKLSV